MDYDAEHETASIIDAKRLQYWFHFRGVTVSPLDAYKWIYEPGVDTFEYALLSASFGYVSIVPKKLVTVKHQAFFLLLLTRRS